MTKGRIAGRKFFTGAS